jgi:endonuclease/exonuclease/phosphatase family metal-dependent hydrolase
MSNWLISCLLLLVTHLSTAQPLTVAAYNIRHGKGLDNQLNLQRTAAVLKRLDADLIALQEVDSVCARSGSINQAAELGQMLGMNHAFGRFMAYDGGSYGMAVLSRFPILDIHRHHLPEGAEPRCALEVVVELPGKQRLSFVSIHHDWTKEDLRIPQVKALINALETRQHPIILAGDFNTLRSAPSFDLLQAAGFLLDENKPATFPAQEPTQEIDYVLLRGFAKAARVTVVKESMASDHRPIYARVKPKKRVYKDESP